MFSDQMVELGKKRSTIREIFEYGNKRAKEVGRENIFDFSLGNPNVPAPRSVTDSLISMIQTEPAEILHGYTSAPGMDSVRQAMAEDLNKRFGTKFRKENFYMTVGAAAAICTTLRALAEPEDEVVVIAPFFPEYKCWIEHTAKAKCVVVPADTESFQICFDALSQAVTSRTKAVIVCYSYSKSLSVPGERIGYVLVPDEMEGASDAFAAICGAGRILGYVNAPGMFQRAAAACTGQTADISVYEKNRNLLYDGLAKYGYFCVKPQGAFYLFLKAPEADEKAFCEHAKKYDLLLVPGSDFGCPGYVRISYCVKTEMIERALPVFERLAEEYH